MDSLQWIGRILAMSLRPNTIPSLPVYSLAQGGRPACLDDLFSPV